MTVPIYKDKIVAFHQQYFFLNNYFKCKFTYKGLTFGSAEAAFQSERIEDVNMKKNFTYMDPYVSKTEGDTFEEREDWTEAIQISTMKEILLEKFRQNENLKMRLIETGEKRLLNYNLRADDFWGIDKKRSIGDNHLGKILEEVRDILLEEGADKTIVRTSYFAKARNKYKNIVSIASSIPDGYKCNEYTKLAPTDSIVSNFRSNHDEEEYTRRFKEEVLSNLDPVEVLKELGDSPILVCWEGSDKFCHRHIVSKWLADGNNMDFKEV